MKRLLYSAVAGILPFFLRTKNKQHFSILTYHRVLPQYDCMRPLEITLSDFEWQMELISTYCNVLSLHDALRLLAAGDLPPRAVCVTFDDGYADNEQVALPVLKKFAVPATVFVSTDFLNGGRMWNDTVIESVRLATGLTLDLSSIDLPLYEIGDPAKRRQAAGAIISKIKHWPPEKRAEAVATIESLDMEGELPLDLMMSDKQVMNMSHNGVEIGAHTLSHPILSSLVVEDVKNEITGSKLYLESLLGKLVESFAYPNGKPGIDYTEEHRNIVEESGYKYAVSTHWGAATAASDVWQLPRFTPWDRKPLLFLVRLLLNFRNPA